MAYQIIADNCTSCSACETECPTGAISMKKGVYVINPKVCTECDGHYASPQCASVCPVEDTCVPAAA